MIAPEHSICPPQEPKLNNPEQDATAIGRLDVVPTILEVICRTTGLGFSAVARVTEKRWIACAVRDEIDFGLRPGAELQVATTICDEIRDSGRLVAINNAAEDEAYCGHPTPKMYGFQSYISVPIRLKDGRFFGTLCAIDPKPRRVNTRETIAMFELFANLIALHFEGQQRLEVSETAFSTNGSAPACKISSWPSSATTSATPGRRSKWEPAPFW